MYKTVCLLDVCFKLCMWDIKKAVSNVNIKKLNKNFKLEGFKNIETFQHYFQIGSFLNQTIVCSKFV